MPSYEIFGRFYDEVMGDRADHAAYLRSLIERHHPEARTVLELACGTGSILRQLAPTYEVTGVDLSPRMLAAAKRKVPEARFALADMRTVRLAARFDVVLCVYDSINHLRTFRDWETVFARARDHLEPRGVFVFDINTQRALAELVARPPAVIRFGEGHVLVIDVRRGARGSALWNLSVFEHRSGSGYRLHEEEIEETSFPVDRIRAALSRRFRRVSILDAERARPTSRSERLHFVCRA
jgi:SAM-dependent methyltransferase